MLILKSATNAETRWDLRNRCHVNNAEPLPVYVGGNAKSGYFIACKVGQDYYVLSDSRPSRADTIEWAARKFKQAVRQLPPQRKPLLHKAA